MALVVLAVGITLLRVLVVAPVRIESASMAPTYAAGDVVIVTRSSPSLADLERGDLVVFRDPVDGLRALKRVVGLPGDELVILDGVLHLDGEPVAEPWVDHALVDGYYSRTFTVPAGHVFVLGDNRGNSIDSRDYGSIPTEDLVGTVLGRVWPPF